MRTPESQPNLDQMLWGERIYVNMMLRFGLDADLAPGATGPDLTRSEKDFRTVAVLMLRDDPGSVYGRDGDLDVMDSITAERAVRFAKLGDQLIRSAERPAEVVPPNLYLGTALYTRSLLDGLSAYILSNDNLGDLLSSHMPEIEPNIYRQGMAFAVGMMTFMALEQGRAHEALIADNRRTFDRQLEDFQLRHLPPL